jgi:hypothetical protein
MAVTLDLTKTRIQAGHWEGVLRHDGAAAPTLLVTHQGTALAAPELRPIPDQPGHSHVRIRIPAELLGEGVHSFLICEQSSGAQLAQFSIIAGEAVEDDLRSELSLLRAELDMLKKAFRRHCTETA